MGSEVQTEGKSETEIEVEIAADNALEIDVETEGAEIQGGKQERMVGTTTRRGRMVGTWKKRWASVSSRPACTTTVTTRNFRCSDGVLAMMDTNQSMRGELTNPLLSYRRRAGLCGLISLSFNDF